MARSKPDLAETLGHARAQYRARHPGETEAETTRKALKFYKKEILPLQSNGKK
ncbi:MAG: hypothetical protein AAB790_03815 [Patescibacteria group bacterium]